MDLALKRETEALLAEHLDELLGQTPWGICVMSAPSLRILAANALYAKLVSAPDPACLIGSIPGAEVPDPLTRQLYPLWEAALRSGETRHVPELTVTRQGMACHFEVTCVPLKHPDGSPSALVTMITDVTRYKRLEEELRESEERYRALAEHSGVGILQVEAEHLTITYTNPAMQALLEAESSQELIGRTYQSLFTPESYPTIQRELEKRARGIASTYEVDIITKSGRQRTVVVNGAPILSPEGKLESVIATLVDITERKRIEDALRESEARYRALAENSGVGIMQLEAEHYTITYTNPATRALLEAESPQELIGKTYQSLFTPESFVRVRQELAKRARGIASTYEADIITKSGRRRTVVVNGAPILSPEGKLVSVIGTLVDITERRRTMEALRESEARFRTLSATAPIGIFQMDARGYGIYVNERWQAITSRSFAEGLDLNWLAMIYPEDRPRVQSDWEQTVKTGGESQFDMRIVTPGGLRWVDVRVAPILSPDGRPSGYVGTMEDITERKLTEDALRESEARFRTLSATAPIGIFQMNAQGYCTYVNERWQAITGRSFAEGLGSGWLEAIHPEERAQLLTDWEQTTREAGEWQRDIRLVAPGGLRWVSVRAKPFFTPDEKLAGYVGTLEDITERRQVEEERTRLLAREQDARAKAEDAERRMAESLALLDTLLSSAPIGLGFIDTQFRYVRLNDALASMNGIPAAEHIGRTACEVIPSLAEKVMANFRRVLETQSPILNQEISGETPFAPGEQRSWLASYYPVRTASGRILGIGLVVLDITERKRTEQRIKASEANYRAIFNSVNDAIMVFNPTDYAILDVNRKMCEMYGYTAEEARQITVGDLSAGVQSYTKENAERLISQAAAGEPLLFEWQAKDKSGRVFWVEVSLKRAVIGGRQVTLAIVRDISERKRTEAALEAAHEQVLQAEQDRKHFYGEVIRAVTHDRLHLVEASDIPVEGKLVLDIPLDSPEKYHDLREQLRAVCLNAAMSEERAEDLVLATGEAVTNAVKHAVFGRCSIYLSAEQVVARVSDKGKGIRPEDLPGALLMPGFSTKISLGMGYTLMLQLVDRVWLATSAAGTVVQLDQAICPKESEELAPLAWEKL